MADVAWAQWRTLGFMAGGDLHAAGTAFIDPEALLLFTLDSVDTEPRLDQALSWWASVGADLISMPRLGALQRGLPDGLDAPLAEFAARAVGAGATSSAWKRLAAGQRIAPPERLKGVSDPGTGLTMVSRPSLIQPAAAMLRARAIAGVGARADVIAFLAARGSRSSSVAEMQKALGYTYVPLRRVTDDLVAARLARTTGRVTESIRGDIQRGPIRFAFNPGLLDLGDVPPWRYWPQIAAFLIGTARWGENLDTPTPYLLGSTARDLYTLLQAFWIEHPLPAAYPIADPREHPGEAYVEPFATSVESVVAWLADGLPV